MAEPAKELPKIPLRTLDDLKAAYELIYNQQAHGLVDGKTAEQINSTLKGQRMLILDFPAKLANIFLTAQIKKVTLPEGIRKILPIEGGADGK